MISDFNFNNNAFTTYLYFRSKNLIVGVIDFGYPIALDSPLICTYGCGVFMPNVA